MSLSLPVNCRRSLGAILVVALALWAGFPTASYAEILSYTHTVRQPFTGSQSPDDARAAAVTKAKREVLEKAGTYIDSITVVRDYQLVQEQITALSAAVLKAEIISQKNYASGESFGVEIEAKVCIDTATLEERIKKFLGDKSALAKAQKLEQREQELLARIRELERAPAATAGKGPGRNRATNSSATTAAESAGITRKLAALEASRQALSLWDNFRFTDPEKALALLNEAIDLDGSFAEAFNNRGIVHADLGQWPQAISDYDQAILLDPSSADAHNNRGTAYATMGELKRALKDFDRATGLNSCFARAYYNKGTAHAGLKEFPAAIVNFTKACELDGTDAAAYFNRGNAHAELGEHLPAIADYDLAIKRDPKNPAFYVNRALAHTSLGEFGKAINDLDQAGKLDPADPSILRNRGIAYFLGEQYENAIKDFNQVLTSNDTDLKAHKFLSLSYLMTGDMEKFCQGLSTACRLGNCRDLELARNDNHCHGL